MCSTLYASNVVFAMDATTRLKGAARLSEISVNKLSGFLVLTMYLGRGTITGILPGEKEIECFLAPVFSSKLFGFNSGC